MAKWFGRQSFALSNGHPIITFTFDDFPRSALFKGGGLLERAGVYGTYFISHGLMGQTTATGEMFHKEDLPLLLAQGHELGCHTFHHYPAWDTSPAVYESSVSHNASTLAEVLQGRALQTHSYPINNPRPKTKRQIGRKFRGCRGGGQNFNHGTVDLNYVSSFFLEQSRDNFGAVERLISANADAGAWLVFSTHDVCDHPTRYGCTPAFFENVVRASVQSGAQILTMSAALDAAGVRQLP